MPIVHFCGDEIRNFRKFKIFKIQGDSIGGTWFWNKYPGVGCDVVSHLYSYSFFKNPNWSKSFSLGDEILSYMVNFWKFAKLQERTKLQTTVENMEWSENEKKWIVQIKNKVKNCQKK